MPLDDLEEDRRAVAERLGEDLQQVAVLVAIDEDLALLQLLDGDADLADAGAHLGVVVVGVGGVEELDALRGQLVDGAQDVVGREREVLGTGPGVELEVLVDLRLLLGDRGLVEGELHAVVAVGDDLGHQGRVLGRDVVTDELGHVDEAHDPVVEGDPFVHLAELDVADDVVERLEEPLGSAVALDEVGGPLDVARQVGPGVGLAVDGALHEGVPGLAVGRDRADAHRAVLVADRLGLLEDRGASRLGLGDALVDVGHLERDVDDAVAVLGVVGDERAVGAHRALDDEADRAGLEDEGLVVAVAVLGAGVADELHAPGALVVVRRLRRIADDEDDRVPARHGEGVALLVVLDEPDELLELVEVELGLALLPGEFNRGVGHGLRIITATAVCNRPPSRCACCAICCHD